ncbi:DedA family protein [Calidifontibacter terrae]
MLHSVETWLLGVPPLLVYLLVGGVVGLESLGIPLPGEVVLVAAAIMSAHSGSDVSPLGIAIAAVLGASIGDSIGYGVGHRYGDRLFTRLGRRFPHHFNEDTIDYAAHLFKRYGMVTVFVGRFIALLRVFAGPLSGTLKMHYPRFLVANVSGAIVWGAGTTYAVFYLGKAAEIYLQRFSYVALAIAVAVGIGFSTVLRKRLERNIAAFARERHENQALVSESELPDPS